MAFKLILRKYTYWLISISSVGIIVMSIYYWMGGFDRINVQVLHDSDYYIAGIRIQGEYTHKAEAAAFKKVKDIIKEGKINGVLCIVDYKNDTLGEHEANRIVGVLLDQQISSYPSSLELFHISSPLSYTTGLSMHPLVMPNTRKVENALIHQAHADGVILEKFTIEMYFEDNSVIIEMCTKSTLSVDSIP